MIQVSRLLHTQKPEAQEALKRAGITEEMDDPAGLIQLDKHLTEQKVGDRLAWLKENKSGSERTREVTVAWPRSGTGCGTRSTSTTAAST